MLRFYRLWTKLKYRPTETTTKSDDAVAFRIVVVGKFYLAIFIKILLFYICIYLKNKKKYFLLEKSSAGTKATTTKNIQL